MHTKIIKKCILKYLKNVYYILKTHRIYDRI